MPALESKLRRDLERTIVQARNLVVAGVEAKLHELTVHEGKRGEHLSEDEAALRVRLRAHARQIGDSRNSQSGAQAIDRLVQACAYEQWHRMIFVRFLAENEFLLDPDYGQAILMEDLREIADEANADPWELGSQFAAKTLPAIFRPDDPLLQVKLSQETRSQLESLLDALPKAVFTADDSLGWVYQFWQSEEKDRVNREGEKITGRTLPAVTQLFTEQYMVLFLLHNTIGAWHAGKVLAANPDLATSARDEAELRQAVRLAIGQGYDFEYLRFVREPQPEPTALAAGLQADTGSNASGRRNGPEANAYGSGDDEIAACSRPWRPMGGTFAGWPQSAAELKVLDPSCGSGHFLVAALELLAHLRMHEEGLSVDEAVEAVIRDNLFGLEIDPRCTQIAAFNVAMAAWKLAGPKPLPPMRNIACSGIPLGNSRDEWMKSLQPTALAAGPTPSGISEPTALAAGLQEGAGLESPRKPNGPEASAFGSGLGFYWGQLYDMFSHADTLGSLINPQRFFGAGMLSDQQLDQLSTALASAIASDSNASSEQLELAAAAQGLTRATELLAGKYTLVVTNVPFRQGDDLTQAFHTFASLNYQDAKADLATVFYSRIEDYLSPGGASAVVLPQGALYKDYYAKFRRRIFRARKVPVVARLGAGAFNEITGEEVKVCLILLVRELPDSADVVSQIFATNGSEKQKAAVLASAIAAPCRQEQALVSKRSILMSPVSGDFDLLEEYAGFSNGIQTGDYPRFGRVFWELCSVCDGWEFQLSTVKASTAFGGREHCILWQRGGGQLYRFVAEKVGEDRVASWLRGLDCRDSRGVAISAMGNIKATLYCGELFDDNTVVLLPKQKSDLAAIWHFCSQESYNVAVRRIDQSQKVRGALLRVPFKRPIEDSFHAELPEPESDDPTQWLFHGRPEASAAPLQVAVARLLGYRWPAELDREMRLSQRARDLVAQCHELDEYVDDDGIVCIPSVRGEDPAADRLLRLLNAAGVSNTGDLDDWLRNRFFQEHCELFHQRPFIWHIWDGHKDGFSALVNYHKLAGPTGAKLLESLTYSYLGDWITRQEAAVKSNESGADARLIAARQLQQRLIDILHGEPPFDIFVRWKPLHEQPIGWQPDINDGVRMNIRPFMAADLLGGRKGAGVLRYAPKIKWTKDRGKEPKRPIEDYPWFWSWDEKTQNFRGGDKFTGERWYDLHYTNAFKQAAREAKNKEAQA